jgi:hypothetical protein
LPRAWGSFETWWLETWLPCGVCGRPDNVLHRSSLSANHLRHGASQRFTADAA